jgi:hypothetical protein
VNTRLLARPRGAVVRAARPQLAVMSAQLIAGAGNLLFAVILARVLAPGEYASIVTFLALFVLLHVPSAALSAAGALSPERIEQLTGRVAVIGVAVGATIIAASGPLGNASGLDRPLVIALGLAAPAAVRLAASPTATSGSPASVPASSSSRPSASAPGSCWRWQSVRSARRSASSSPATPPSLCARRRRRHVAVRAWRPCRREA